MLKNSLSPSQDELGEVTVTGAGASLPGFTGQFRPLLLISRAGSHAERRKIPQLLGETGTKARNHRRPVHGVANFRLR